MSAVFRQRLAPDLAGRELRDGDTRHVTPREDGGPCKRLSALARTDVFEAFAASRREHGTRVVARWISASSAWNFDCFLEKMR